MTNTNELVQLPDSPGGWPVTEIVSSCRSIFENREQIIGTLNAETASEAARRAKAIETYIADKQNKEHARWATRVLEAAIGAALGPVENGQRTDLQPSRACEGSEISKDDAMRFRTMHEYQDVWLAPDSCTRTCGARNRILKEIKAAKERTKPAPDSPTCTTADLYQLAESGRQFGCIYIDPPWLYENQATRASTGNHYGGMTVDELCDLPVRDLAAADSHLHLWITNGFLFEAPKLFNAWGFEFRSSFIWVKPQTGIGNYWRNSHEILLTAIRGNAKSFNDHSMKSWGQFDRTAHSAKPEQIRNLIERASAGPYLELFGRRLVEGWTVWGDQIERNLFNPEAA